MAGAALISAGFFFVITANDEAPDPGAPEPEAESDPRSRLVVGIAASELPAKRDEELEPVLATTQEPIPLVEVSSEQPEVEAEPEPDLVDEVPLDPDDIDLWASSEVRSAGEYIDPEGEDFYDDTIRHSGEFLDPVALGFLSSTVDSLTVQDVSNPSSEPVEPLNSGPYLDPEEYLDQIIVEPRSSGEYLDPFPDGDITYDGDNDA